MQNHWLFSSENIYFCKCQRADEKKKVKTTKKEELNSAHCRLQAKCQLLQTVTLNELSFSCFCHIINILLTELSRSVWENLDRGRVHRPHCVRSVLTTSVKILPYRPPARLIRAKYQLRTHFYDLIRGTSLKGHCHALWQLYKRLEGAFASIEFWN